MLYLPFFVTPLMQNHRFHKPSWPILGHLGAILGPSLGHLGAISVVLGTILASSWAAEALKNVENAREVSQKREDGDVKSMWLRRFLFNLNVFSLRGRPEPSWDRLGP